MVSIQRLTQSLSLSLCFFLNSASAVEFVVTSTVDEVDAALGDGLCATAASQCTLRAAVQEANALAGADVITLPAGLYNIGISGSGEDLSATGDYDISSNITINGAGAGQVFIDAFRLDRVFDISTSGVATLNGLTIRNGSVTDSGSNNHSTFGGGIKNYGVLTLNDCNVDRNNATADGGGIYSFNGWPSATLTINRSVISNNVITGSGGGVATVNTNATIRDSVIRDNWNGSVASTVLGGGIFHSGPGFPAQNLAIINSTISNNHVIGDGGGIYNLGGTVTLTNSTVSANSAGGSLGGGFFVAAQALGVLNNVTVAFNSASVGGNLYVESGATATLENSIVSANTAGGDCVVGAGGTLIAVGNNLDSDGNCSASITVLDPLLGALADNDGPGYTHALLAGSPAIDGAASCLATDQRSYARPGSNCDLGAYEVAGVMPAIPVETPPPNTGTSLDPNNSAPTAYDLPDAVAAGGVLNGMMSGSDPDGDPLIYVFSGAGPSQGSVGMPVPGSVNSVAGAYIYTPLASASGTDSFTYHVCDNRGACSADATMTITITSGTVDSEINVTLTPSVGNTNDLTIVSESGLNAIAADPDYTYPLGGYFFTVDDVPTDSGGAAGETVITIQLAASATIPADAEVRKMDVTGTWRTLGAGPSAVVSTAVIDTVLKTITLTLRDNDMFDLNAAVGVIDDPIAIGVPVAAPTGQCRRLLRLWRLLRELNPEEVISVNPYLGSVMHTCKERWDQWRK